MSSATAKLLTVANAYCKAVGLSKARVSTLVFNDGKKLGLLANGADLTTGKYEYAMAWFKEHWPTGVSAPT